MTSTTTRSPIKPKTLTLLQLCDSYNDFRHPTTTSIASYHYQASANSGQILTRRLLLHPVTLLSNIKPQSTKRTHVSENIQSDIEQRHTLNSDRSRESNPIKHKSPYPSLAVLSSSFPLMTRMNGKIENRHSRDKSLGSIDDETISDFDTSITGSSLVHSTLPPITRGTTSSTGSICTRPTCVMNYRKTYKKLPRIEKVDVWNNLDRALQRPIPIDPPTTPLESASDYDLDDLETSQDQHNSTQEIKIYKRIPISKFPSDPNIIDHDDDEIPQQYLNENSIQEIRIVKKNSKR